MKHPLRGNLIPAVAAVGLVLALAGCGAAPSTGAATSTRTAAVERGARQYAGHVPWKSAVLEADGRTVHLLADWNRIDHFVCDTPNERLQLQQTPTAVRITIRGYAHPLPKGVACGGVGAPLQPFTVHLTSALDDRPLVDGGFNTRRPVLHDESISNSHDVPAGYRAQPLTWNAESASDRTATRTWQKTAADATRLPVLLHLTVGLPTTFYTFNGPLGMKVGTVDIDGSTAQILTFNRGGQVTTSLRWTRPDGQQTLLEAIGTSIDHLTQIQVTAFARTLKPAGKAPQIEQ